MIKLEIQQISEQQIGQIVAFAKRKKLNCYRVITLNTGVSLWFEPSQLAMVTNFLKKVL